MVAIHALSQLLDWSIIEGGTENSARGWKS